MSKFISDGSPSNPCAYVQWKGTDLCMDFYCECGAHCHYDGYSAYTVKCPHCGTIWEMPCFVIPRRADERTYEGHRSDPKELKPDEDYSAPKGSAKRERGA